MGTRAAIYTRVSQDKAGGRSVDEQEAECRRWVEREGWELVGQEAWCDNSLSASRYARRGRPEWLALAEVIDAGDIDVLVAWEISRTTRDRRAWASLIDACISQRVQIMVGGRLHDPSDPDDGFMLDLGSSLAVRESAVTRKRLLRAVQANAAQGRPHGRLLYGYERRYDPVTKALIAQVPREDQAAVVREAARRVHSGETPYAVAKDFNVRGIPTPRGRDLWTLQQIKRLVINPGYAGHRVHQGKIVGAAGWPAIIDEAVWAALVKRLSDPKRRSSRDSKIKHLLSGLAVCGVCGDPLRRQKNRQVDTYMCPRFHVSCRQEFVDDLVTNAVTDRLGRADVRDLVLTATPPNDGAKTAAVEAAELQTRLEGFYDQAADGGLTPAALAQIEKRLLPQIEAAEIRARPPRRLPAVVGETAGPDAATRWVELSMPQRRQIIAALMVVRILPAGRGRQTFNPERIKVDWRQA